MMRGRKQRREEVASSNDGGKVGEGWPFYFIDSAREKANGLVRVEWTGETRDLRSDRFGTGTCGNSSLSTDM